jgi:hypothetical protein
MVCIRGVEDRDSIAIVNTNNSRLEDYWSFYVSGVTTVR